LTVINSEALSAWEHVYMDNLPVVEPKRAAARSWTR